MTPRESVWFGEEKSLLPVSGIDPWFHHYLACILFTIQTELPQLFYVYFAFYATLLIDSCFMFVWILILKDEFENQKTGIIFPISLTLFSVSFSFLKGEYNVKGIFLGLSFPVIWPQTVFLRKEKISSFLLSSECTTRLFNIKIYIKMLLHVSVNKPSSGSLLLCFAKVIIIKIVS